MDHEFEWSQAQKIEISVDLVNAAKRQLKFLSAVDRKRFLYEGPALERAIYRYNACWLPLLAKHSESPLSSGPFVVPLDCEWIWHCHRLNPVQYKSDCKQLYGRILDNSNVESSVQGISTAESEEIWTKLYPKEPFSFNFTEVFMENMSGKSLQIEKHTKYDLISAVKRQSPFFYQVSRPHMDNDLFLEEAVARYRGFLYIIKRNRERSMKSFSVPTYDIDLIWHSHQLHPVAYCENLSKLLGSILEHDDMDSDRTKGKKLNVGFSGTTKHWEHTFGTRYWRAGAMYNGSSPAPLTTVPYSSSMIDKDMVTSNEFQKVFQIPEVKVVEILLEFVAVKNLPVGHKGDLFVTFSKTQPDILFKTKRNLTVLSESREKQVASFQSEPTGELIFELKCQTSSNLTIGKTSITLGSTSLPLKTFLSPLSKLYTEKWLELKPTSSNICTKPINLRVAISFTVPSSAPREFSIVSSRQSLNCSSLHSLSGKMQHDNRTRVIDEVGNEIISLHMRKLKKEYGKTNNMASKEVIGITKSGDLHTLAEFVESRWSLMNSQWLLNLSKKSSENDHLFEIVGNRLVKFFLGRKLEYEPKSSCEKGTSEKDFITAVEFSDLHPYGRAVALFNFKYGFIKVKEEWMVVPGITLAFILSNVLKKKGYNGLVGEAIMEVDNFIQGGAFSQVEAKRINAIVSSFASKDEVNVKVDTGNSVMPVEVMVSSAGCGGCGSGYGNMAKSGVENKNEVKGMSFSSGCGGGCGSGCGSGGCGSMVKSGGCGGCGGGCGNENTENGSGCGGCSGSCGGGCGNMIKSSGCGGCSGSCSGGCGNMIKSSGCGGCGGGCGNMIKSSG